MANSLSSTPTPSRWRLTLVVMALLLAGLGVMARLVYLQVLAGDHLRNLALTRQRTLSPPTHARLSIQDRNGNIVAIDQQTFTLFAHPFLFKVPLAEVVDQLAPILNLKPEALTKTLQTNDSGIPVAYELSETVARQIRELSLDGLELNRTWERHYPQQELLSGVIGYVDQEHQGQAGIEFSQNKLLQPPPSQRLLSMDGSGLWLPDLAPSDPQTLSQEQYVQLTIDSRLQRVARNALRQQMRKFNAQRGTVIVMSVQDGSLLALASEPAFNPTKYYQANPAFFRNWAVADLYEPGSTFKPINVAIALQLKAITPTTVLPDEGRIQVGGWPIQNNDFTTNGGRGALAITQILGYSSNVAMVHMMNRMRASDYYDYLKRLGLEAKMGTDLPFETPGQLKPREQFVNYPIEPATTAFGQGFSLTPLKLAQLTAAIANGGNLVTPHVISGIYRQDRQRVQKPNIPSPRQVFAPSTAQAVLAMLGEVVKSGTGKGVRIPGYRIGGKTGTAQKAINGVYTNQRITSFVGVFPLDAPRYVVLTVVDDPKGDDAYGSTVAVPVVKAVLEGLITIEGIPPSHPTEIKY